MIFPSQEKYFSQHPDNMKEIEPGIFQITEPGYKKITPSVNIYILSGPDAVIFDAGYGHRSSIRFFIDEFREIEKTVLARGEKFAVRGIMPSHSHGDHFSGLVPIRRKLKIPIILTDRMHSKLSSAKAFRDHYWTALGREKPAGLAESLKRIQHSFTAFLRYRLAFGIRFISKPDHIIPEQGEITVNAETWEILYTPGHARDHISLYNKKRGILLGGDTVLRKVTTWLGPPESDLEEYKVTLEKLLALEGLRIILTSHGSPVTEPQKRIKEILAWREERTAQVHSILRAHGKDGITIRNIIHELYPDGSRVKADLARGWVELTLAELEYKGLARSLSKNGSKIFFFTEK